jgi:hypothetical protein
MQAEQDEECVLEDERRIAVRVDHEIAREHILPERPGRDDPRLEATPGPELREQREGGRDLRDRCRMHRPIRLLGGEDVPSSARTRTP